MQRSPQKTDGILPQSLQRVNNINYRIFPGYKLWDKDLYFFKVASFKILISLANTCILEFDKLIRPLHFFSVASYLQITELEGVVEVRDAHFWTLCTGTYLGSMRLDIQQGSDPTHLVAVTRSILKQTGLTDVIIEVTVID